MGTFSISDCREVYYVPGSLYLEDLIHPETGLTVYSGRDEAAVLAKSPEAKRMPIDDAVRQIDVAEAFKCIQPVSEIRSKDYWYALEVLPPDDFRKVDGVESFKLAERTRGAFTEIFAECGERYFTLTNRFTMPAREIAKQVRDYIAAHPIAEPSVRFERDED